MPGADSSADTVVVNFPYHSCVASNCSNWILICVPLISHLAPQPLCNLFHNRERNRDVHTHARTLYTQSPETQTQAGRQACKVTHVQREWRTHDRSKKEVREKQREKKKAGGARKSATVVCSEGFERISAPSHGRAAHHTRFKDLTDLSTASERTDVQRGWTRSLTWVNPFGLSQWSWASSSHRSRASQGEKKESHFHLTGNERGPCVWRPAQLLSFSFSLGRLSNHAVTFHFKVTACYIWYLFFFFQLLFLQTELYRNLKVFNFLHPKYQLKKQTKNLFSGKWNFILMLFFALNCFEILLEALRITHNMIPQPVEVWCHYCTETWLSATQEMHHIFKI